MFLQRPKLYRSRQIWCKGNHFRKGTVPELIASNMAEKDEIIAAFISQVNGATNVSKWMVNSGASRHICANRNVFTSYIVVGVENNKSILVIPGLLQL